MAPKDFYLDQNTIPFTLISSNIFVLPSPIYLPPGLGWPAAGPPALFRREMTKNTAMLPHFFGMDDLIVPLLLSPILIQLAP